MRSKPGPTTARDGGRSFGFTGGHFHHNWANENFRRLVTNGILWTAKIEVPTGGAKVEWTRDVRSNCTKSVPWKWRRKK